MNIFYFDRDPSKCAQQYIDKHVIKMILESVQILCTIYRLKKGQRTQVQQNHRRVHKYLLEDPHLQSTLYQATHIHHPAVQWAHSRYENWAWLTALTYAINDEYQYRYEHDTPHKSILVLKQCPLLLPNDFDEVTWSTPISCMDKQYQVSDDPIENYRNYYKTSKASFASWKKRPIPDWFIS